MRIHWTTPARLHLRSQARYIAMGSPITARLIATRVHEAVRGLAAFPFQGRPGRVENTRELVVQRTPFTVAYRVAGQIVEIVVVVHQSQQWPERFE